MPFQGWGREEILFKFLKFQGVHLFTSMGSPGGSVGKESACNVGALGLDWEDPLEEGMATLSSILAWRIPMDRGAWRDAIDGVTKSWTQLSTYIFISRVQFFGQYFIMKRFSNIH